MTEATDHIHAADIPPKPKGAGHNGLVASMSKEPETSRLADPDFVTSAIPCRQTAPPASHPALLSIETARKTATPFSKSP